MAKCADRLLPVLPPPNGTHLERPAGVLVAPPILFLVLPAAVRHQFAGTAPRGRGGATHVTLVLRHRSAKLRKRFTELSGL
jgi:hypothetical protein